MPIPAIPKADYSPPLSSSAIRPTVVRRNDEDFGGRKDKVPQKAIRTPSGRSFTATEYLKSYSPGQAPVAEEGSMFFFTASVTKNDVTRKMIDFDTFTKVALECERFGRINCC